MKSKEEKILNKDQLNNLNRLHQEKKFDSLEEESRKLLLKFPNNTHLNNYLGASLAGKGLLTEAIIAFNDSLIEAKNKSKILNNLGVTYLKMENFEKALDYFEESIIEDKEYEEAHFNKGNALRRLGRVEEAIASYENTLKINPDHINSQLNISIALKNIGRFEESKNLCRELIKLKPAWGVVHRHLTTMVKYKKIDNHVEQMLKIFNDKSLDKNNKSHIAFGLGKAYEDLGKSEEAFSYFSLGNKYFRSQIKYSTSQSRKYFAAIKRVFNASFFVNNQQNYDLGENLIFITGMPRSGTSLIEQILASHSNVYGAGELKFFREAIYNNFPDIEGSIFPDNFFLHDPNCLKDVADEYLERVSTYREEVEVVVDKMPYNFMYIGMIHLVFPLAKIISIQRNAIDNCFSIYKQKFGTGNYFSYSLQETGEYYNLYNELMNHWNSVLPEKIFSIQYEKLTLNQEKETKRLLDHCSLNWEEDCLSFHKTSRDVRTASSVQVRQPLYNSSVNLWKNYKKELKPLIEILERS